MKWIRRNLNAAFQSKYIRISCAISLKKRKKQTKKQKRKKERQSNYNEALVNRVNNW